MQTRLVEALAGSGGAGAGQEEARRGGEDDGAGAGRAGRGRLREGDALARLAAAESSRAARVERNNFKCYACKRVRRRPGLGHGPVPGRGGPALLRPVARGASTHAMHGVLRNLRAALQGTSRRERARTSGPARRRVSAAVGRQKRAQRAGTDGRAGPRGAAQTRCQEGTPLVLCDGCPLSFHLACLDVAWRDLPEAEWTCPKARRCRCRAARPRGAALGPAHASCMGPASSCPLHVAGRCALPGL